MSGRSARLPLPKAKRLSLGRFSLRLARFYSTHRSSRNRSNSLKTKDGRHRYPSRNWEGRFSQSRIPRGERFLPTFFTPPVRSKLARESSVQESRSRWLAHHSR